MLRDIDAFWTDEGFARGPFILIEHGERRTRWADYERSVDWADEAHLERVARVYEQVLPEVGSPELQATMVVLLRDGWTVTSLQQIRPSSPAPRLTYPAAPAAETTVLLGRRYLLDNNPVGTGGFGAVYFATDTFARFGDPPRVAVKMLLSTADKDAARRFEREITIISGLRHPNVLRILDSGNDANNGDWYAMPIADRNLQQFVPGGVGLDAASVLEVLREVSAGIQHLHTRNSIHRDLTPGNVLRVDGTWKVSDFGLSVAGEWANAFQTTSVFGMGTPGFRSPEQTNSFKDATYLTDIYSLGKLAQFVTTGVWPTDPVLANNPLRGIIQRATQYVPEHRYGSASDFLAAVEVELGKPPAGPETATDNAERFVRGLKAGSLSNQDASEILGWLRLLDPTESLYGDHVLSVVSAFTWEAIQVMWAVDADAFEYVLRAFCEVVLAHGHLGYSGVDGPAFVMYWSDKVAQSPIVRQLVITSLSTLGRNYNRWMAADLVHNILKSTPQGPLNEPVISGFRSAGEGPTQWALRAENFEDYNPLLRSWLPGLMPGGELWRTS
ncbi:serine/threonine-protein kinase [Cryobacterium sp. PAMC25264]|uniref:serine/threonine-protein kinase n=1 Tax=Cryobacterium sp. PAMC25264 TaxID=2861288 RepID=UPI001C636BDF|nr:serine/threonine-protein kinase [Cryobacterium sp. PAMC25264]QYF74142.1 serine/threonine protein kinase [Cryobacterium sp. PAMC25264]